MEAIATKISILLTLIVMLIDKTSAAIKCYECTVVPTRRPNVTERLCSKFDESDFFKVNCEFSTMCTKKVYRLKLQNGEWQETFERGCANQKHNYMDLVDRKWVDKYSIEEPYQEGCTRSPNEESEYCYCRGNLCNSVGKIEPNSNIASTGIDAMNVLIVFNLVKYFRNMDYL